MIGCDSDLAKEASSKDGVCLSGDVEVDVYFVGDVPKNLKSKVQQAIAEHGFQNMNGIIEVSDNVEIVQTKSNISGGKKNGAKGSTGGDGSSSGPPIGAIVGAIAAAVVVGSVGYFLFSKKSDGSASSNRAKPEQDTDEESDDDNHNNKVPVVQAVAVDGEKYVDPKHI